MHKQLENTGVVKYFGFHEASKVTVEGMTKDELEIYEAHRVSHYLLVEWCPHGDLHDNSIKLKQPMGELVSRYLFKQIVDAIDYLHSTAKFVHRDVKLENILLDKNHNIKLCDFAMSKTLSDQMNAGIFYTQCGSERYMAPEIIEGRPYKGTAVDIFALGVSLFAMVTGVLPFDRASEKDKFYCLVHQGSEQAFWDLMEKSHGIKNLSDEFKRFIWEFFKYNYYERITVQQIRENQWFCQELTSKQTGDVIIELDRRAKLLKN